MLTKAEAGSEQNRCMIQYWVARMNEMLEEEVRNGAPWLCLPMGTILGVGAEPHGTGKGKEKVKDNGAECGVKLNGPTLEP